MKKKKRGREEEKKKDLDKPASLVERWEKKKNFLVHARAPRVVVGGGWGYQSCLLLLQLQVQFCISKEEERESHTREKQEEKKGFFLVRPDPL